MFKTIFTRFSVSLQRCFSTEQKVGIIGVPFGRGGPKKGAINNGPDAIRNGGLIEQLTALRK